MKTDNNKKICLAVIAVLVSGLLMLLIAGTFFIRQELDEAAGNSYVREHIKEHIIFAMTNHVFPLVFMNMAAAIPLSFAAEPFLRKKNIRPEASEKLQLIGTPIVATAIVITAAVFYILANIRIAI